MIYGTYNVQNKIHGELGRDFIQPGITNYVENSNDETKYYAYYQWVGFVLLFQALLYYIPYYVGKTWEAGRNEMLSINLNPPILDVRYRRERKFAVINNLHENLHHHNTYVSRFIFCELLNLMNITAQILFIDFFLGGEFKTYGIQVLKFIEMNPEVRIDPTARISPKVTKCTFHKYGPSGGIQLLEGLSWLPLNIFRGKNLRFPLVLVREFECVSCAIDNLSYSYFVHPKTTKYCSLHASWIFVTK